MASIGELFIELGVKADTQQINKVDAGVKSLRSNLLLVSAAFTGAVVALDRFVNSALKGVVSLQNLNAQTGLSIQKLQQFQQAGQLSNLALSADQIAQSIGNVQKNIAAIRIGQGDISPFQLLGVDVAGQDAFGVIEQLRGAIQGLDPATATNLISQIGLSPDFINILRLSRKEFELLSENTFLNPKQRADIDKVGTSIKALQLRFKALKDQAVAKIAPELNKLVQQFFKWMKDNGKAIIEVIAGMARGFAKFAQAIGNAFSLVTQFIDGLVGMERGIKILAGAFALLTLSFSPFLAGLAAIILLLDDIAVFRAGGDSVIGELVKAFEDLPDFAKILGIGAGGATLLTFLGSLKKALGALAIPTLALAAPLASVVASLTFLAKSQEFGKKIAEVLDRTAGGRKLGDSLLDIKDATRTGGSKAGFAIGGLRIAEALTGVNINNNNTYNIQGLNAPEIGAEIKRSEKFINQTSLKQAQDAQGNNPR
jgi:hypothetical protein